MLFIGIIPARFASTRFPGKPLVNIHGRSMIMRVYEQALKASCLKDVYVATDDSRIFDHVKAEGGKCLMTPSECSSGTERCFEAFRQLKPYAPAADLGVVNIQGDEPFISPEQIRLITEGFCNPHDHIVTLKKEIFTDEDIRDPNIVKVVTDIQGNALYFSRSVIPYIRNASSCRYYKHIGIYAYRAAILEKIVTLQNTPLETAESLEQLRWLENGLKIKVIETTLESISIDTPGDLNKLEINS